MCFVSVSAGHGILPTTCSCFFSHSALLFSCTSKCTVAKHHHRHHVKIYGVPVTRLALRTRAGAIAVWLICSQCFSFSFAFLFHSLCKVCRCHMFSEGWLDSWQSVCRQGLNAWLWICLNVNGCSSCHRFEPATLASPAPMSLHGQSGLEYHNSSLIILNGSDPTTLCTILIKFGLGTPVITRVEIVAFGLIHQKLAYPTKCLWKFGEGRSRIFWVCRHIVRDN